MFPFIRPGSLPSSPKKYYSPILIEKNDSRRRPGKMTDRGLKKKFHRMMPIEHFLIDIIQILFRDWIDKTTANIGRCKAATDIFQPTLRNFFYKRWPIIFFYCRGYFSVRCCRKNLQCRSARVFRSSYTELCFDRHRHVFICLARKTLAYPGKNLDSPILIEKNASRRRPGKLSDRGLKKKHRRMTPIEHFLTDISQILFRDWIEKTIADIGS